MITLLIPASNEEHYIGACLSALLASERVQGAQPEVIVIANGCHDRTAETARSFITAFADKGWTLQVLDLPRGSKIAALNKGDQVARYNLRAYIDADIRVSPGLIAELAAVLDRPDPAYASGRAVVPRAKSFISRRYARFWQKLPFMTRGVPGCGVFAVNGAGRARWGTFPDIISDDTFARFHFAPAEMHGVPALYDWPITEGFARLVRVRRRQNEGLREIQCLYPDLAARMPSTTPDRKEKFRLFLQDPLGFVIYSAVAVAVHLPVFRNRGRWDRGR
jgi:glycosyltransferase involved in cell wall biosynthesis